jgi:hypothetical protein
MRGETPLWAGLANTCAGVHGRSMCPGQAFGLAGWRRAAHSGRGLFLAKILAFLKCCGLKQALSMKPGKAQSHAREKTAALDILPSPEKGVT